MERFIQLKFKDEIDTDELNKYNKYEIIHIYETKEYAVGIPSITNHIVLEYEEGISVIKYINVLMELQK